jgi:hypothetical protein
MSNSDPGCWRPAPVPVASSPEAGRSEPVAPWATGTASCLVASGSRNAGGPSTCVPCARVMLTPCMPNCADRCMQWRDLHVLLMLMLEEHATPRRTHRKRLAAKLRAEEPLHPCPAAWLLPQQLGTPQNPGCGRQINQGAGRDGALVGPRFDKVAQHTSPRSARRMLTTPLDPRR